MYESLAEKTVLVTGATSGIGRETATRFGAEGATVVCADIDGSNAEELVETVEAAGGTAHFVEADVTDAEQVAALVAETVDRFGSLDVAHNNAGIGGEPARTADVTESDWDRVLGVNLRGVWLCLKHELPAMVESGGGAVVNTASIAGFAAVGSAPYVASKHGVIGLTRTAASEYAEDGVRVNAVCPGVVDTALTRDVEGQPAPAAEAIVDRKPLARMGEPAEDANAVCWLASEQASFVTGTAYPVDGGFSAC